MSVLSHRPVAAGSVALLTLALMLGGPLAAFAQHQEPWKDSHKNPEVKKAYDEEYHSDIMKDPIDLPNLPLYSGKTQFLSGITFPNVKGGATINMRFMSSDSAAQVLQFYKNIFSQRPWTLDKGGSVGTSLAAVDDKGHIGNVTVLESFKKGKEIRTQFIVIYKHVTAK